MPDTSVTTLDGAQLWVATNGGGTPLVLCHGGPGYWDTLEPVAAMLEDCFTVHRWDQRGAARSSHDGPYSTEQSVADLEAIREHFGYESWVVGGHSWGASLALLYALDHGERTQALLYLCGTGLAWWPTGSQAYGAERLARLDGLDRARFTELRGRERTVDEEIELRLLTESTNYFDRTRAKALAVGHLDTRFTVNGEANAAINSQARSWNELAMADRCTGLDVPALVLLGEGDPRPAWACDSLVAALPRSTRVVVPEAGHEPWLENASGVRRALRDFLVRE